MKNQIAPRTDFEKWLFDRRMSFRAAGEFFGCSHEYVRQIVTGIKPATGEIGTRIKATLAADGVKIPDHQPGIAGETAAADRPRSAAAHSSVIGRHA